MHFHAPPKSCDFLQSPTSSVEDPLPDSWLDNNNNDESSTVNNSPPQSSTAHYSQVQPSTELYSPVQPSTAKYSPIQPSTAQYSKVQPTTAQQSSVQPSTIYYTPEHPSTARHPCFHSLSNLLPNFPFRNGIVYFVLFQYFDFGKDHNSSQKTIVFTKSLNIAVV